MKEFQQTNDFNEIVYGRRSIKTYDPSVKISREEMTEILKEASTAPSSINMQPWRFLVIDSEEGKQKLAPSRVSIRTKFFRPLLSLQSLAT